MEQQETFRCFIGISGNIAKMAAIPSDVNGLRRKFKLMILRFFIASDSSMATDCAGS